MGTLLEAISEGRWQLAALSLLLGMVKINCHPPPLTLKRPPSRFQAKMAKKRSRKDSFYAEAVSEAERLLLTEAMEIEGLDEEIALLRVKLMSAISEHPENTELLLKGIGTLVKAVGTKYRLSKKARENLTDAISQVLKEIGGALYPEGFDNAEV